MTRWLKAFVHFGLAVELQDSVDRVDVEHAKSSEVRLGLVIRFATNEFGPGNIPSQ